VIFLFSYLFEPLSFCVFLNTMASLISLLVLLDAVTLVASNPVAQPTITASARVKRDFSTNDLWTGWYQPTDDNAESTFTTYNIANDYAMVTTDSFVYLCNTATTSWESTCSEKFATACTGTTAYFLDGGSSACEMSCNADTVFTTNTIDTHGLHWFGCADRAARLYFEIEPTETTLSTPTSSSSETASPGASSSTPGPSPTSSEEPESTSNSASGSSKSSTRKGKSKAWVAGPVIGALAAIAIAGLIFFILRRRKQNAVSPAYQPAPQSMQSPHPYQSPSLAHATLPSLPPYGDHNGYYGQLEGKPDNASVYAHHAPGYAPAEGTMQMPAGVSEYNGAQSHAPQVAQHGPVSELPSDPPTHDLPELGSGK